MSSVTGTVPAPAASLREKRKKTLILSAPATTGILILMNLVPATVHSMSMKRSRAEKHTLIWYLSEGLRGLSGEKSILRYKSLPLGHYHPCHSLSGVVLSAGISVHANNHRKSARSAKSKKSGSNALSDIFSFFGSLEMFKKLERSRGFHPRRFGFPQMRYHL